MMFVTLVSVLLGMITIAPGFGVPLAFVAFFTWLRTVDVGRRRASGGSPLSSGEKILLFMRAYLSTVALFGMLGVAGIAAIFSACFVICALDPSQKADEYIVSALVAAFITVAAIVAFVKLVQYKRRSWRRDIGEPDNGQNKR
jgi:hypothetical protein